ncbi:DUF2277 domain-containing protein [bacterium]|nr:MAG: DUF2277 domain-containing protein [bacterium]
MCRNIKVLYHFEPPASADEIRAAALQYVRKISGFTKPSQANQAAFDAAVEAVAAASRTLIDSLETSAPPRDRALEAARARLRGQHRFAAQEH